MLVLEVVPQQETRKGELEKGRALPPIPSLHAKTQRQAPCYRAVMGTANNAKKHKNKMHRSKITAEKP